MIPRPAEKLLNELLDELLQSESSGTIKGQQGVQIVAGTTDEILGTVLDDVIQQIPGSEDFEHSIHSLRPLPNLASNLPTERPGIENEHISALLRYQMREAKLIFNLAVPLGVIGMLVAIVGAFWSGAMAVATGGFMEVLTLILLKLHSDLNQRLAKARQDELAQARYDRLFATLLGITDPTKRDETIARFLLHRQTPPQEEQKSHTAGR